MSSPSAPWPEDCPRETAIARRLLEYAEHICSLSEDSVVEFRDRTVVHMPGSTTDPARSPRGLRRSMVSFRGFFLRDLFSAGTPQYRGAPCVELLLRHRGRRSQL